VAGYLTAFEVRYAMHLCTVYVSMEVTVQWLLFTFRCSGQVAIYFPPRITQQLQLLNVVCRSTRGRVRQTRNTSGALNRSV